VRKKYRDKGWLLKQYVEKKLTQSEMAEKAGCGQHTISRWLRKYDINTRDKSDYITHPFVGKHPKGYIEARCQAGETDDRVYIHRLVAVAEYGFDEVCGMDVHHKNGFGRDNRPENIELRTPEEHMSEHRTEEVESGEKLENRFK
jgi:transcriptional regulator with XRE-family HTH domain